jgi:hypothetical protein
MANGGPARNQGRVAVLTVAPAVLCVALVAHPFISGRLPNEADIAEGVTAGTTMWAVVHLAASVASALIAIAFLAVRSYLREAGENRHSARGVPLVVMGSTLFAVLPGMEFAPLAAAENGATTAEVAAAQSAIVNWFILVLVLGALTFAAGVFLFAIAIWTTRVAGTGLTTVVVAALIVMAVTRFVPLSIAQFYAQSAAALVALWPLAYLMWSRPVPVAQSGTGCSTARPSSSLERPA